MALKPLSARSFFRDPVGFVASEPAPARLTHVSAGRERYVVVRDPADAWQVLVTDAAAFPPGKWKRRARRVVGDALNTLHGSEHRERRRVLAPALNRSTAAAHEAGIAARAGVAVERWPLERPFAIRDELDPLCLGLAAEVLVSGDLPQASTKQLATDLRAVMAALPLWRPPRRPTAGGRALRRADAAIAAIVETRRAERAAANGAEPADRSGDALDALLAADLSGTVVRGDLLALFLAAVDEPPSALEAAAWLLACHPGVQQSLRDELGGALGDRPLGAGTAPRLPQLQAVLAETLRLFPPARHVDRCPHKGQTVGGARVPAGANVLVSPLVLHNDPSLHRDVTEFAPERWLADNGPPRGGHAARGGYLPFGAGPHACIGEPLARTVMAVTLASILRCGRLMVDPDAAAPGPGQPPLIVRLERA